ncbi:MAG: hypothetical protein CVV64_10815 [Candidatus Wallbacteria bacterium HGW-Wallbacteria-1]|jgi:RNA polymerase sigma-70 factor (ECF subfamily)|uniref:RNA polymerase sigma factor n=1 Tax=Candidatus Wallbacteria bacterium HGW-Wallbacteria-1 TaxID=2013854 RepID=A0A2N1PPF3_9BACT|nr:MAG: hypothetical protein CVV64_10815 [Candidatus Wallbacteria bacterium HGW-Wallbacteria-1]
MDKQLNRRAVEELFRSHKGQLTGYLHRLLQNREEALDIVQETFVRALGQSGFGDPGFQSRQWIFRVATNLAFSAGRRIRRSLKAFAGLTLDESNFQIPAAEHSVQKRDEMKALLAGLGKLDYQTRSAILLRYFENMSCQEIGEILSLPTGTVMTRLHRGRQALRSFIESGPLNRELSAEANWEEEDAVRSS